MPSKKKKYNARFPAGRIKKIMQSDEEVGKVAQAVPVIISRTLELFVESLLTKTLKITNSRNAKTLSPSHMKQCIMSESRFDFLRELVKNIPDISVAEESCHDSSPGPQIDTQQPYDLSMPSTSCETNVSPSTRNGNLSGKNGVQGVITDVSGTIVPTSLMPTAEQRCAVKRHWEHRKDKVSNTSVTFSKESSVIQHTSDQADVVPPKLMRMESAPTAVSNSSKNSTKRLMHQAISVPCSSKEASYQQPVVPAPIVDINICNKPIVKIDYSNLVLPDKDSSSGSSSDQNSVNPCINPVINIDLSKIGTQSSCDLQAVSIATSSAKSTLELDEDYDNI